MRLFSNPLTNRSGGCASRSLCAGFTPERFDSANRFIRQSSPYVPTPLLRLDALAARVGVGGIYLKDERHRFGLRSFKALGGPYAVREMAKLRLMRCAEKQDVKIDWPRGGITIACASAGNHGQGVAAGARLIGARCKVFLPKNAEAPRVNAIREAGGDPILVDGGYDHALAEGVRVAEAEDWLFVSDTSAYGDEEAPRLVMLSYATLLREAYEQMDARGWKHPSHLFVQAGVGSLAGALAAYSVEKWGHRRPIFTVVEPERADCLMQSAKLGAASRTTQDLETGMAGLACGQASPLAWEVLSEATDHFVTCGDEEVSAMSRALAAPPRSDPPITSSLTGVAGLAPLNALTEDRTSAKALGLNRSSIVFGVVTEDVVE